MGEVYLADTNVVSKYFEEKLPEWALVLLDEAMNSELVYLSVITRIELKVYKPLIARREQQIQAFIDASTVLDLSEDIILQTIRLRRQYRKNCPTLLSRLRPLSTTIRCSLPMTAILTRFNP